jgi:tripartite-type tricarboxylate transporter receptor subunit TctC
MASRQRFTNAITTALGAALLLLGAAAFAEDAGNYPTRPVMMIVPFAPGGASDFVARTIQNGVSEILGQQIVVDNRPGAAGIIGTEVAARAAPDGYTTFLGNVGTLSINASVYSNMRIKPDQDLAPVTMCGPAVTDVLGGHVDIMFTTISSAMEFVKGNKVKALAVTTRERMAELPDIPTMHELGWTNLVTSSWQGVLVPSGTPRPIIEKLRAAIVKVLADPAVQARMRTVGAIAAASQSPEEFKAYMDGETAKWNKVIQESGVRAD